MPPLSNRLFLILSFVALSSASYSKLQQASLTSSGSKLYLDQQLTAEGQTFSAQAQPTTADAFPAFPIDSDEIRLTLRDQVKEQDEWDDYYSDAQIDPVVVVSSSVSLLQQDRDLDDFATARMPQLNAGASVTVTPRQRQEVVSIAQAYDEDDYSDERFYYAFAQVGQEVLQVTQFPVYEREDWDDVEEYTAPFTSSAMMGDMDDNDETDLWPLTRTAPTIATSEPASISVLATDLAASISGDTDEVRKTTLLQQSQTPLDQSVVNTNPAVATDALTVQSVTEPLARDTDDLPDDVDDDGDDPSDGDMQFLLVTSFTDNATGSGKVWVIPKDSDDRANGFVLIGGLQQPVGVCFDVNNEFLYVVDLTSETSGAIYQYEIDWDDDDKFELKKPEYTVVYQGQSPYDCSVDEYGNLFFVDPSVNQVNMINYLDLWSGFLNQHIVLYSGVDDLVVSRPIAIEAYEKKRIYWLNSENGGTNGLLIQGPGRSEFMSERRPEAAVRDGREAFGLAVSDDYVYYTLGDGSVWAYDRDDKDNVYLKTQGVISQPRGACYGDDHVYVADHDTGTIYRLDDDHHAENPDRFVRVQGAYNVHCVNQASQLLIAIVLFLALVMQ